MFVGDNAFLPRSFTAEIRDEALPVDSSVRLAIEIDERGVATCRSLKLRADRVSGDLLRRVPLGRLMRNAVGAAMEKFDVLPDGRLVSAPMTYEDVEAFRATYKGQRDPHRGKPLTDEQLRATAETYRAALKRGVPPTRAVMDEQFLSRSGASRRIALARKKGFLGKARPRRAGEE